MHRCFDIDIPFQITGIYTAYDNHWDSSGVFQGESHDFWELVMILSGQAEIVEDDNCYVLGGGMMICHAPSEFHRIKSAGGTSPHFLVMTFRHEGELPHRLCDGVFNLDGELVEEYLRIFNPIREFYQNSAADIKRGDAPRCAGFAERESVLHLEHFLLRLSQMDVSEENRSMSVSAREYRSLVQIMTERVRENICLSALARERHISESYVKKLFRTYAGEGFTCYYARLRVNEIKRLLDAGESVSYVAEVMNFSSSAYLSAFFKKHTGMTPSKYIEKSGARIK